MKLLELSKEINSQIDKIKNLSSNRDETKDLRTIKDILEGLDVNIKEIKNSFNLFRNNGITITFPKSIKTIKSNLQKIKNNFQNEPNSKSIKKGNYYQKFIEELEEYLKINNEYLKNKWSWFCEKSYSGDAPEKIDDNIVKIVNTDNNKNLLTQYRMKYSQYNELRRLSPSSDSFKKVQEIGIELAEIYSKFDQDAPEDVKKFLSSVTSGGASINLLTEQVINWLKEKDLLNDYKIVRGK